MPPSRYATGSPTNARTGTDASTTRMTHTASAASVLRSAATHTLFYINSQCKQVRQFSDDHATCIEAFPIILCSLASHKSK